MTIEIIAIGGELLCGYTTNTNVVFMGRKLLEEGFAVSRQEVVPDEFDILTQTFKESLSRSSIVIVTGGLGPTLDDITKDVAAKLFDSDFKVDSQIAKDLKSRYGNDFASIEHQSTVPSKAIILKNKVGTAPGFIFENGKSVLILIPGPPEEMRSMMIHDVIPYIKKHCPNFEKTYVKSLHFFGLPEISIDPTLRNLKTKYPLIEFGIYPGAGKVSVVMKCINQKESDANDQLNACLTILVKTFKDNVFLSEFETIEEAICHLFIKKKLTLSIAESCTGGFVSSKLVSVAGSSKYFLGGFTCYSDFFKEKFLSVPKTVLEQFGAVSSPCVKEMALNLLEMTASDYSLTISGIAGPSGGSLEKPVGTIFGAIGFKGNIKTFYFTARGNRSQIIEWTANIMLFELYKVLSQ